MPSLNTTSLTTSVAVSYLLSVLCLVLDLTLANLFSAGLAPNYVCRDWYSLVPNPALN